MNDGEFGNAVGKVDDQQAAMTLGNLSENMAAEAMNRPLLVAGVIPGQPNHAGECNYKAGSESFAEWQECSCHFRQAKHPVLLRPTFRDPGNIKHHFAYAGREKPLAFNMQSAPVKTNKTGNK